MATLNTSRTFYFYLSSLSQYLVLYLKVSYLALFNISISQEKSRKTCLAAALIYSNLHTASYLILIILSAAELYFSSKEQKYNFIYPAYNKNGKNQYFTGFCIFIVGWINKDVFLLLWSKWHFEHVIEIFTRLGFHFYCSFISITSKNSLSRTIWIVLCENKTTKIIWRHYCTK